MTDTPDAPKSHGRLKIQISARPRDLMEEPRQLVGAWVARIITLFPEAFPGTLGLSLTGKALDLGLWRLEPIDLRPFVLSGKETRLGGKPRPGDSPPE